MTHRRRSGGISLTRGSGPVTLARVAYPTRVPHREASGLHREYDPAQMAIGHHHDHEHDHDAERRTLLATTAVVGVFLGLDLLLPAWGGGTACRSGSPRP